ncbi:ABC transporter substrate-binding protein [Microbacterium sp. ASV49]|uniref:ABC transporter substrate-binding protein n=1 Tax=Microbacterium candidum TaxID=3041922 RepID=A0ABT7MZG3_9MICO|nr:ABC transporter substrate-binding protein [Microbacterium sp. ASV49]MDL9979817.1 ABC transporter substrate-binding protein [Microbacterium sp. ASV49]
MSFAPALRRVAALATAVVAAVALTACSGTAAAAPTASGGSLQTVTAGKLTIATGNPDYEPWFIDNEPSNGKGFEGAVAKAVAEKLGYTGSKIVWVRTGFDEAIAPGPKDWDLNIQQFSITDQRKKAVDFSSPYYTTTQAVVAPKGSPAASAKTLDALKKVKVGVASGTTSYTVAKQDLGTGNLAVFNSVDDVVLALKSGQIDAMVTDLPGAFYITGAQLDNGVVVGQFAGDQGGDQFGVVLPKNSSLTPAVTKAVDELRADGTLAKLQQQWLTEAANVPVLK